MQDAFRINGKPITISQAITLNKKANNLNGVVRGKTGFANSIQAVLNYAQAFEENAVPFADARVLDIVNTLMSTKLLTISSKAIYERYICVAKVDE